MRKFGLNVCHMRYSPRGVICMKYTKTNVKMTIIFWIPFLDPILVPNSCIFGALNVFAQTNWSLHLIKSSLQGDVHAGWKMRVRLHKYKQIRHRNTRFEQI